MPLLSVVFTKDTVCIISMARHCITRSDKSGHNDPTLDMTMTSSSPPRVEQAANVLGPVPSRQAAHFPSQAKPFRCRANLGLDPEMLLFAVFSLSTPLQKAPIHLQGGVAGFDTGKG